MTSKCVFYWLLAVLLAAMLCIGSVTAVSDIRNVESGSAAFVYEKITVANQVTGPLNLTRFTEDASHTINNRISSDAKGVFTLDESAVGTNYGTTYTYYLTDTWDGAAPFIVIWYPEISLQATTSSGKFIDGKTIDRDTVVSFQIQTPKFGGAKIATAKIVITTPTGEKIPTYGTADFSAISLTWPVNDAGSAAAGSAAIIGTYTAQAEYTKPQAFADFAKKSNTISFTVKESSLQHASDGNMENAFRVLFDTQGGSFISPTTDLSYGDRVVKPADPTREGYTFGGWYTDSACTNAWSFSAGIDGDITLYAKWTGSGLSSPATATSPPPSTPAAATTTAVPISTTPQPSTPATAAASAAPVSAAGVQPTLTQAPAPVAGLLFGLGVAALLIRRRN